MSKSTKWIEAALNDELHDDDVELNCACIDVMGEDMRLTDDERKHGSGWKVIIYFPAEAHGEGSPGFWVRAYFSSEANAQRCVDLHLKSKGWRLARLRPGETAGLICMYERTPTSWVPRVVELKESPA
ncbi:MAG: hypothetical protein ACK53T_12420 [Planctomycetota bacterium]|jgi:hypothetical protein